MPSPYSHRVTVSLREQELKKLSTIAEKLDVSISWVIRKAIDSYLQESSLSGVSTFEINEQLNE